MNNRPYDRSDSDNPYLINTNNKEHIIGPENISLSAEYIWSKSGKDREELVDWVFRYYRKNGFPSLQLEEKQLQASFNSIIKIVPNSILNDIGEIKNTSSTGTDIIKHFCGEKYYKARMNNSLSVYNVFSDDNLFKKVLKNRMGWCTSKEDGIERPYVFGINDKMILQGIKSSGLSINVSQFKPAVAKFIYNKYVPKNGKVFDYSAGWGARLLAALSLGIEYYGTDPNTFLELRNCLNYFKGNGKIFNMCSEDKEFYKDIPLVDFIMSSPPYFDLEIYSDNINQSNTKNDTYDNWLENYWKPTVNNSKMILKNNGLFCFIAVDKVKNNKLYNDMKKICEDCGLYFVEELCFKTSNSHLSKKRETGKNTKTSEKVCILKLL